MPESYPVDLELACEKVVYKGMQDVLKQAAAYIEEKRSRSLHLPPSNHGRTSSGERVDRHASRSPGIDDSTRRTGSPARSRNDNGRGMVLGPNGSKSWRSDRAAGAKPGWEDDMRAALPRGQIDKGSNSNQSNSENALYKTRLCERFETEGFCPYGNRCTFAHGTVELRIRPTFGGNSGGNGEVEKRDGPENPLYKTRLCERFMREGFCQYGPRCNFAHSPTELRDRPNHGKDSDGELPEHRPREPLVRRSTEHSREASPQRRPPRTESPPVEVREVKNERDLPPATKPVATPPPAPAPAQAPTQAPVPVRARTNESVSFKDLLRPEAANYDKAWVRSVQVSDDEREKLVSKKKDTTSVQQAQEEKYVAEVQQKLTETTDMAIRIREITRLEFKHDWSKQQLFSALVPAYFKEEYSENVLKENLKVFKEFVRNVQDQSMFLRSFEKTAARYPKIMAKAQVIIRDFYANDIVEEEQVLQWASEELKDGELKKRIKAFIDWLETAEEEDE
ncbi:hypothetical protein HK097_001786 [Rhizophlyctis rosea]|uniref:Uncharacterized protein n=1 Tax=Rhizophlyctis rosea TaxID=64517 RepID=A0AAD5SFY4_9FUNG|nr:hypothetical protein HK097_001786 [Rhizophlyctis rosea]